MMVLQYLVKTLKIHGVNFWSSTAVEVVPWTLSPWPTKRRSFDPACIPGSPRCKATSQTAFVWSKNHNRNHHYDHFDIWPKMVKPSLLTEILSPPALGRRAVATHPAAAAPPTAGRCRSRRASRRGRPSAAAGCRASRRSARCAPRHEDIWKKHRVETEKSVSKIESACNDWNM